MFHEFKDAGAGMQEGARGNTMDFLEVFVCVSVHVHVHVHVHVCVCVCVWECFCCRPSKWYQRI